MKAILLHPRPRRPRAGSRRRCARRVGRADPPAPRRPAAVGARRTPTDAAWDVDLRRRLEARRSAAPTLRVLHTPGPRARAAVCFYAPDLAASSPATRCSRAGRARPAARSPTGRPRGVDPGEAVRPARRHGRAHRPRRRHHDRCREGSLGRLVTRPRRRRSSFRLLRSRRDPRIGCPDAPGATRLCVSTRAHGPGPSSERPDQQAGPLAGDPGQHDRGLVVAGQRQPLAQLVGDDVDAALLDRQPADAALAQGRAQRLLAVGERPRGPRSRGRTACGTTRRR